MATITSIESFKLLYNQQKIGDRHLEVIQALIEIGSGTDMEIAGHLNKKDPNYVRPRRNELVKDGIVGEIDQRNCSYTGRTAVVWGLTGNTEIISLKDKMKINSKDHPAPEDPLEYKQLEKARLALYKMNTHQLKNIIEEATERIEWLKENG